MPDEKIYYYRSFANNGVEISLIPEAKGRYKVMYGEENLGSYATAVQALDDLIGGHTFSPSDGADTSQIGLPDELGEWDKRLFAEIKRLRPS